MNYSSIILIVLFLLSCGYSQSKTEEAKEKLDEADEKSGSSAEIYSDNIDEDDGDIDDIIFKSIFEGFVDVVGGTFLNIPIGHDNSIQQVFYYKYPYYSNRNNSFRTFLNGDIVRIQTNVSFGKGFDDFFNTYSLLSSIHLYGWALKFKYKYMREDNAPYPLNYMSGKIERKSKALRDMDMGFSAGVSNIKINNSNYSGFSIGYNLDIFFYYPYSINVNPNIMFYKNELIYDFLASFNIHKNRYFGGIEYNHLNIIGVKFNSFGLRLGIYL